MPPNPHSIKGLWRGRHPIPRLKLLALRAALPALRARLPALPLPAKFDSFRPECPYYKRDEILWQSYLGGEIAFISTLR